LPRPVLDGDPARPDLQFTLDYHEGAAVGYKWFDRQGLKPLFPFGHGLSYTEFAYSDLVAEPDHGRVRLRFKVSNVGKLAGKDVPQLYAQPLGARWEAPKRLVGWDKVALQPGETRTVSVQVDPRLLAMFDGKSKTWRIAAGMVKFSLARNAGATAAASVAVRLDAATLGLAGQPTRH
jgi:beta-glucosidase